MAENTVTKSGSTDSVAEPTSEAPLYQPPFDIFETDTELTLYGDLPGAEQKDLDVRYEDEQLTIQAKVAPRSDDVTMLRQEYGVGNYYRRFLVGESIDTEKITAELNRGVLIIHLPKAEAAKPKRIQVKAV